jgi:Zn-dependent peptidase ImmA (M78 family)
MPASKLRKVSISADPGADLAHITPGILTWAIGRSGMNRARIATKLKVEENHIKEWEEGTPLPFEKARSAAKLLQIPFGYFFLAEPPNDSLPLPDRRRLGPHYTPTPEFLQFLNDVLVRQDWYSDHLRTMGHPSKKAFIGSFALTDRVTDVAADIRNTLKIKSDLRNTISSWAEYLSALVRNAEDAGILVMRSSVVGNSTSRPITTDEVQGFAIADPVVPIVFVNSGDYKAAQVFTFAHELAHLWIGQSAITKTDETEIDTDRVEAFCNRVAADVLVPQNEFQYAWDNSRPERRLETLPRRFWVSSLVILRRAHESGKISVGQFHELLAAERAKIRRGKKASGGDFYRTLFIRMGNKFTHSVMRELARDNLLVKDAARLLSVSPKTLPKIAEVTV